jgi:hypothetical protein
MSIPLQEIDHAIALGAKVDTWPEVKAARAAQERIEDIGADRLRLTGADPAARIRAAVEQYAVGKITAEEMVVAVANINAGIDHALVNQLVTDAADAVAEPHRVALRRLGDRWIESLRPEANRRAANFARTADRLPNRPFFEQDVDPLEWRNLGRALDAWNEVLHVAEALGARPERWLHPERRPASLVHSAHAARSVAVMMHHAGAEAGVWTRAEVRSVASSRAAEPVDLPPAA